MVEKKIEIPEKVEIKVDGLLITVKGPKGEIKKKFQNRQIEFGLKDKMLIIKSEKERKREKKAIGSIGAHVKNMLKGATEGHIYKLKICSGHFPMNVSVKGNELIIKNFVGEKVPRVLKIKDEVNVKVEGDKVIVESSNKELAGQVSADIELLTKRAGYDTRIFQDGVYIISKDGKEIK